MSTSYSEILITIFMLCGIDFFIIAVAILVQPRMNSAFKLANNLGLFAAFALLYGLSEWFEILRVVYRKEYYHLAVYEIIEMSILVLSYGLLFEFGRQLISFRFKQFANKWLTVGLCFFIFIFSLFSSVRSAGFILVHYFLGFISALIAALGFVWYYFNESILLKRFKAGHYLIILATCTFVYSFIKDIIGPRFDYLLAAQVKLDPYAAPFFIALQIARLFCAAFITWAIFKILGVFNSELKYKTDANLRELVNSKNFLEKIIRSMTESLIVVELNGKIEAVNAASLELLGYTKDELVGRPFSSVFSERSIEEIIDEIEEPAFLFSKSFKILHANDRFIKEMGVKKDLIVGQYCYKTMHNLDHICYFIEQKCPVQEADKENKVSVELHSDFDAGGNRVSVAVAAAPIKNRSGETIYYLHTNNRIGRSFKKERIVKESVKSAEIAVEKIERYVYALEVASVLKGISINKLSELNAFRNLEMYYESKIKDRVPVILSGSIIRDENNRILGIVCIAKDMREIRRLAMEEKKLVFEKSELEKKSVEELQRLYYELEKSHSELKNAQAQLIETEKMEVVGRLASGVAHEVKNPLGVILQGVEFLSKKMPPNDEEAKIVLGYINNAVEKATNTVMGLLDFSSVSKMIMRPESINSVIESAILLIKNILDKNNIELIKDLKKGLLPVNLDKNRIEQVLVNLMLNAVQAMAEGGRLEIVTYSERINQDSFVIVQVKDTGCGIKEESLDKIFDPFFTTKQNSGGTGLGLSVVKNIIEIHGAKIEIKNRQDTSGVIAALRFKAQQ